MADIKIVEPNSSHYEAFLQACKQMQAYLDNENIADPVGKRESKGFIFAQEELESLSSEEFASQIVDFYNGKRQDEENRPPSPRDPSRKIPPEYFYFVMDDDKIIGSVNARPLPRDEFDIKNGLKSYDKWDNLSPNGVRVTTSTVLLHEYRGIGIAGDVKKQFFDELENQGIEEVAATVEIDNKRSNNAQKKLASNYGGRSYYVGGKDPETGKAKIYNRHIVNTNTTGKNKEQYFENKLEVNNKALNEVLDTTISKLWNTPYGRKLFENAIIYDKDSSTQFNLSKIYIGYAGTGIGGNCYREIIDKDKTRDVVYLSDEEIKSVIAKTLMKSNDPKIQNLINEAKKQEVNEPTSRFQSFLENHYKSLGQEPSAATKEQWEELKLLAQIEKIKPIEKLIEDPAIKNMLADSLTHLVAHEISHAGQYNNGCETITKQSFSLQALKEDKLLSAEEIERLSIVRNNNVANRSFNEIKEGRAFENALEAGVMSSAMVAFVLTEPSQEAMQTTIDYYNLRSGSDTKEILTKYDLSKMRGMNADGDYTVEATNLQNKLARDIFVDVAKGMDRQQQDKLKMDNPNADCSYDYTKGEPLIAISSSYRPEIFGDRKDFDASVQSIVASNNASDKPKITFESNPMYSFYGLWRNCMQDPEGTKEALKGFDDERISKIADIVPARGTKARAMADKVHQLIGKNDIKDFDGLTSLMKENFDSHEVELFSKTLEPAFDAYSDFFARNKERIDKNVEAMNKEQSTCGDDFAKLYTCFGASKDKTCTCYLNPFPKDKLNDGISNSENVSMDYSLNRAENEGEYIENSDILKKKASTPFHESTHFLFNNSQLKKDLENESNPETNGVLNRVISKFEKKGNEENKTPRDELKRYAVGAINEAFAACSTALYNEKTTGKPTVKDNEWYHGWKQANDLTRQMYPVFKDYVSEGKPFDGSFFTKLDTSIRIDELRNRNEKQYNSDERSNAHQSDRFKGLTASGLLYKPTQNISKVDFNTLKMCQDKKQNG